jgi:arginyl-tRNA synthetase
LKDVEKTASLVAVGAIKYAVLKQGRGKDIIFDPEKSLSLEGDSGPYLQYAHTRARSLLRMAQDAGIVAASPDVSAAGRQGDASTSDEASPETSHAPAEASPHGPAAEAGVREVSPLERALLHFEGAVARAVTELEPHHITTYLTELASLFNSWYASNRVIGGNDEAHGVLLTQAFANTMQKGLELLGIPVPEEM